MSSHRALTEEGTWTGRVPGRSLATVMSELRRLHRSATNIAITETEWRDEGAPSEGPRPRVAEENRRRPRLPDPALG